ncbi:hypothetical protein SAMN05216570_4239 [Dyella sp. OK004]|uniref:hypothetical protein n=1 Tax=Dyella sp. OK004 TaxID=1855292 RepID=UPI0008ED51CE|nr:hypothetical protein [Dyella sp. OK004]SFS20038.1 hypothetical protein SAMN05216570_4239 [Dyella sp. OK004]
MGFWGAIIILLAVNVVKNLGHPELVLPAIAFVVGLHFLPMAFAIPFKPFYALGVALIVASIIGGFLSPPLGGAFAGLVAGFCLWTASALAMRREMSWAPMAVKK